MKEIKINIKTEHIQALLEGKKMVYDYDIEGLPRVTLIPDRYGVFITAEKYFELRKRLIGEMMSNPEDLLKDIFGEFEKYGK